MSKLNLPLFNQNFYRKSQLIISGLTVSLLTVFNTCQVQGANTDLVIPTETPQISSPVLNKPQVKPTVKLSPPQILIPENNKGKNNYLDTNNYYSPTTPKVVINDRQKGCQTVVSQGNINQGNCGKSPLPPLIANKQKFNSNQAIVKYSPRKNNFAYNTSRKNSVNNRPYANNRKVNQNYNYSNYYASNSETVKYVAPTYTHATRIRDMETPQTTALLFPLTIPARISSTFGWRVHPITGNYKMHYGTDIVAPSGTPVLAAYDGVVAIANELGGYGLTIVLRHVEESQESRYAHLSKILVKEGDQIKKGSVIGLVGSTGASTGPHLHFEWRHLTNQGWVAVDAGLHLELALDNLVKSIQTAKVTEN